ncbi:MAG: DUF3570 domain-containing protein [Flavobacteriaceae bacterium]
MKKILITIVLLIAVNAFSQTKKDSTKTAKTSYKKKVLDNVEVNFLYSNYLQNGNHAAVTGGTGDENLTDNTPAILISIPLNDDDVLSIDFGVDITTSASTDQINPFGVSTTSSGGDDDKVGDTSGKSSQIIATSASGGGGGDDQPLHTRAHGVIGYNHTSDNRSFTWGVDGTFSSEKGYNSVGFGAQLRKSFNHENTEFNLSSKAYFDNINLIYPGEFRASEGLAPSVGFKLLDITHRNTISASLSFSQILTKRLQISLIADIIKQDGLLSTNYQRVYFKDKPIVAVNNFNLAHDIERLPNTRTKHPFGARLNYYVNDYVVLRTFYRHYTDDWGVSADTYDVQVPIKLSESFTIFPMYRYHSQQQARYFAPYRAHLSTETFYTSDYDLSTFNSSQYGLGLTIAPPLGIFKLDTSNDGQKIRFKSFDLRYNYYSRSDGLAANILSLSAKFTF